MRNLSNFENILLSLKYTAKWLLRYLNSLVFKKVDILFCEKSDLWIESLLSMNLFIDNMSLLSPFSRVTKILYLFLGSLYFPGYK